MKSLRFALKQIVPILFSYLFVGLAFGILMHESGYSPFWTILSSVFIYAGSMQIVMVSLMDGGVSLLMVALMTIFINGRHVFYGIGFVEKFRAMGWKYPYMAFAMTDETYSILCSIKYPDSINVQKVDFYIMLSCHLLWIISSTLGAMAGEFLPLDMTGIDFSATAFFVTVVVNQWRSFGSRIPVITGFFASIFFFFLLGPDKFIMPALSVSLVILVVMRDRIAIKKGGAEFAN